MLSQRFRQDGYCISFLGPFLVGFKRKEQLLLDRGEKRNLFDFLKTSYSKSVLFCNRISNALLPTHIPCAEEVFYTFIATS